MTDSFCQRTVLDSGVTVLTESISSVRSVALGLWFAVGSRSETPEEAGMSHFLEHMLFKGTDTRSAADISESFDRLGAELNAFTSKEYTCYFARFLDEHLGTAVEILSDMVSHSVLDADAVTSEKEVVLEEIHRHDDAPDELVHDVFADALWPGHPLSRPILGTRETVGGFDRGAGLDYLKRHYGTGDLVVAAAGNVDHDRVVSLLQGHLSLPEIRPAERREISTDSPRALAVLTKDTEQAHVVWGVQGIRAGDDSRYALAVLDSILGGGMSSRLFQEIREKRGLAYAVYSYHALHRETGSLAVYVGTRPSNVEETLSLIRGQADSLASHGVTEEELHRAKESIKGHLVLGLESTRNRMTRLGKNEITKSEILSIDEIVTRVDAVQADDVTEIAAGLFGGDASLALVGPFEIGDMEHLVA
jgi:predicted Zn-dependent peptidase